MDCCHHQVQVWGIHRSIAVAVQQTTSFRLPLLTSFLQCPCQHYIEGLAYYLLVMHDVAVICRAQLDHTVLVPNIQMMVDCQTSPCQLGVIPMHQLEGYMTVNGHDRSNYLIADDEEHEEEVQEHVSNYLNVDGSAHAQPEVAEEEKRRENQAARL